MATNFFPILPMPWDINSSSHRKRLDHRNPPHQKWLRTSVFMPITSCCLLSVPSPHFNHFFTNTLNSLPCPQVCSQCFKYLNQAAFHIWVLWGSGPSDEFLFPSTPSKPGPLFARLPFSPSGRGNLNPLPRTSFPSQTRSASLFFHLACHYLFTIYPTRQYALRRAQPKSAWFTITYPVPSVTQHILWELNKYMQIHAWTNHFVTFDLVYYMHFLCCFHLL